MDLYGTYSNPVRWGMAPPYTLKRISVANYLVI